MSGLLTAISTCSKTPHNKPLLIVLIGPPGAGKGTHAGPLSERLGIANISTGGLFRENMRLQTPLGLEAKTYIDQGKLVPDPLTLDLLFDRIQKPDCKEGLILDGFPRTVAQAEALEIRLVAAYEVVVIHFRIDIQTLVERIAGRIVCKNCAHPYHRSFNPPQDARCCDRCRGELYQRDDDQEEVVRKRLEVYHRQTQPVIDYYAQKPGLVRDIASDGGKERVFQEILHALACSEVSQ